MRNFMRAIRPFLGALSRASLYIAGVGMVAMTLIVGWQVFARYILNDSPSWSEPLSLHLMSWFIMLGRRWACVKACIWGWIFCAI